MTTLRAFTCDDLFRFNNINLDPLTETYGIPFYLQYLAHWPEYFIVAEAPGGELMGYIMGKAEGSVAREEWHGHVTALSVAPEFRRLGLAAKLMELLEEISEKKGGFFVDLFVRVSNQVAVNMYKQLGYSVYRTVLEYYSASSGEPDEDAYVFRALVLIFAGLLLCPAAHHSRSQLTRRPFPDGLTSVAPGTPAEVSQGQGERRGPRAPSA
ncbi:N-alpha-acetyltransferase 20 isoform 1-T1 [Alca torda]